METSDARKRRAELAVGSGGMLDKMVDPYRGTDHPEFPAQPPTPVPPATTGCGSYLMFGGMTWPNPADPNDIQWRLRYGTPTKSDLLVAASFMHAYAHLIEMPQRERNERVSQIRKESR